MGQNGETTCLRLVHFYDEEYGIPPEMEANWKSEWLFPVVHWERSGLRLGYARTKTLYCVTL